MTKTIKKTVRRLPREQRIAEISAVARDVFIEFGYEKANVGEIANRLGIVEGTIFSYFATKRELMYYVIRQWYESVSGQIDRGLEGISGTENRLRFVIWQHLTTIVQNLELCSVIMSESRKSNVGMSSFVRDMNKEYTAPLLRVLSEGIAAGEFNSELPVSIVRNIVFGSIEHAMWDILDHGKQVNVNEHSEHLINIILKGIKPPSTPDVDWEQKFEDLHSLLKKMAK